MICFYDHFLPVILLSLKYLISDNKFIWFELSPVLYQNFVKFMGKKKKEKNKEQKLSRRHLFLISQEENSLHHFITSLQCVTKTGLCNIIRMKDKGLHNTKMSSVMGKFQF